MGAHPELRKDAKKVKQILTEKVQYINSLERPEIEQLAQEKYPELLEKEEEEKEEEEEEGTDFIREIINEDMKTGRFNGRVHTRFPPEPNGYLHIGHATSIIMNYTLAKDYDGKFNFRFDDTNPITEEEEYVKAMIEDIKWLGVYEKRNGGDNVFFASDYFDQMYEYALQMIRKGKAYVDDLSAEEIKEYRGTLTEPGKDSPYRDRPVEESLDLFKRMKKGEFPDGARVLRAKIDMSSPNLNMRDPVMYRILHKDHPHTKGKWCIYPMYDWAHGLEDSIEGITHSICTLEFENHRPLYDWYLDQLEDENGEPIHHPQQIEFARVNVSHTIMSKSKLIRLVKEGYVDGWDDPRMPTLAGLRRRGVTPKAIFNFTDGIGVSKRDKVIARSILDNYIREDLYERCPRVMCVLRPLKVIITNYPEDKVEEFTLPNHPRKKKMGTRKVKFSRTLYIEEEDFMEDPPEDYYRLTPDQEVRLKGAYIIKFEKAVKDEETGEIKEIHCRYDPKTRGGTLADNREIKGTIHWISAKDGAKAEVRLYSQLFLKANPLEKVEGKDFTDYINPNSLEIISAYIEPQLLKAELGSRYQFERNGYFCIDIVDSQKDKPVFNRIISLRDSWSQ
ncbi:MAG: glutamine--tRNA ligase/YqeY domain fusion protein [Candidatus Heimdallarchaeota archaeon]|nr:glutamine--tRNA ligase/YqeY domain fusion protein [Candidatus Heimdallarchaeota archaeon]